MSNNNSASTGGIGFSGLLQLIFIVLKLIGKIDWKWIWVLAPTWISIIIVVICLVVAILLTKCSR